MRDVQTRYLLLEEGPASLAVSPARSCYATFNLLAHCFFFYLGEVAVYRGRPSVREASIEAGQVRATKA
jgi:hypothetical protein